MKWTKITLSTTSDVLELVCSLLNDLGIEGMEIEDNIPITENERKAMFIDILPEVNEEDKTAKVSFYLEEGENAEELMEKIREGMKQFSFKEPDSFEDTESGWADAALEDSTEVSEKVSTEVSEEVSTEISTEVSTEISAEISMEVSETEDKDWINNWKAFFKPFRIDETIVIKPTWEKLDHVSEQDLVIEIDPGTAFGTGAHETTKLCILGLKKYITPDTKLLDVGCGSGILSIIGAKLGAAQVLGTDIDPNAVKAAYENAEVNHIPEEILTILDGDIITDENLQQRIGMECYDLVAANILADIIIPLSGEIGRHMKKGGVFISSGIINTKKEAVTNAIIKNGFEILEINEMGDWVSIIAQK
jgi:ribosomal protein L11 methyltransferase